MGDSKKGGFVSDKIEAEENVINNKDSVHSQMKNILESLNKREKYKIVILEGDMLEERAIRLSQDLLNYKIYREYVFQNEVIIILKLKKIKNNSKANL